ncbi:hypothetical protein BpHYR1_046290 [Brachionus plicatilis]|uniref:Uncharacterized protein n=1 Tax=Brachionus plicatilis TaxID=10195 RepID=A0A3M7RYE1_BRAPC|nr:hypothetical protein BpHYR1_046290 [Brachionus plicatilis]
MHYVQDLYCHVHQVVGLVEQAMFCPNLHIGKDCYQSISMNLFPMTYMLPTIIVTCISGNRKMSAKKLTIIFSINPVHLKVSSCIVFGCTSSLYETICCWVGTYRIIVIEIEISSFDKIPKNSTKTW